MSPLYRRAALLVACTCALAAAQSSAQVDARWALSRYGVRIALAIDTKSVDHAEFGRRVAEHVDQRCVAVIGSLWKPQVDVLQNAERRRLLRADAEQLPGVAESLVGEHDKVFAIRVTEDRDGVALGGCEYDAYLRLAPARREARVAVLADAAEAAFFLACELFSPVARFQVDIILSNGGIGTRVRVPHDVVTEPARGQGRAPMI